MIKIFMSVRDRLAITKKSIEALYQYTNIPFQLYVYNNCSKERLKDHFEYFYNLYKSNLVTKITFNTEASTFNAFSKAVASNEFGRHHLDDPKRKEYEFLLLMDNDIIVLPHWDTIIKNAWIDVEKHKMNNIKVIGQLPGGIRQNVKVPHKIAAYKAEVGKLGGSGFWSIRNNFFRDVGFLDLSLLVGHNKKHDQNYWVKLNTVTNGQPYIMGIDKKLCIHCGKLAGSICNTLSKGGTVNLEKQKKFFLDAEEKIDSMSFEDFMNLIINDKQLEKDW